MFRLQIVAALAALSFATTIGAAEQSGVGPKTPATASDHSPSGAAAAAKKQSGNRPQNPRVLFITSKDCPQCEQDLARLRRPGGDFEKMRARGWKIGAGAENHLQIVDQEAIADLIAELNPSTYPTVACISGSEIVRCFHSGCTTPLDVWTFGWLAKGIDERPAASIPEVARVESTGHFPLRGNHWSIDEDWNPTKERVISHLRGPSHGAHIAANWEIETWSYEELRSLHDHLHEQELGSSYYSARSQPANQFSATRKVLGH